MSTPGNSDRAVAPLTLNGGVAAFDPTTLKIAAEVLGLEPGEALRPGAPRVLRSLADVSCTASSVTVKIDTGLLRWDETLAPFAEEFTAYNGSEVWGVHLGKATVVNCGDAVVAAVPMRATTAGGAPIRAWFAELKQAPAELEGFELLARTRHYEARWRRGAEDKKLQRPLTHITVPAQQLTYESSIPNALGTSTAVADIRQQFAANMDETGARVIAETTILTGAPVNLPEEHVFGTNGPVMFWFTEDGSELPFSIIYTTAEAWIVLEGLGRDAP
ncbi:MULTISPECIES: hypothetical protein [Corynebacterium]|uniref:Uncharacterized protein n=1 Tax=Corynebacterium timonense TaxID=441500 RepID=A0A1H1TG79_9CORY|nr:MULTISPECIES: hypothetical protein [Corynebacterium]WJY67158.1 hypothetical protein CAURIS_01105 [Corynebacterium auris]SDS59315.1 hypothetical protein SAMN04488539_1983 [Corynebacterium timonense]